MLPRTKTVPYSQLASPAPYDVIQLRVQVGCKESIPVVINSQDDGSRVSLLVDKAFIHVAANAAKGSNCFLAENGPFRINMTVLPSPGQLLADVTAYHGNNTIATVKVNHVNTEMMVEMPGVEVSGLEAIGLHVLKKMAVIPTTDLVGKCNLAGVSETPFVDFVCTTSGNGSQATGDSTLAHTERLWCHMPHSFKTLFHYNTKLISMMQSAYTDYDLPRSRGLLLNSALAYASSLELDPVSPTAVLADTLETVPLTVKLPKDCQVYSRLSVKTVEGVHKVPVFRADADTQMALQKCWGVPPSHHLPVLYFFTQRNVPVLLGCPPGRQFEKIGKGLAQATVCQTRLCDLKSVADALHLLHYAQQVWYCDTEGRRRNPAGWKQFCKTWLAKSSTLFPHASHILNEAAASSSCNSIIALLCLTKPVFDQT